MFVTWVYLHDLFNLNKTNMTWISNQHNCAHTIWILCCVRSQIKEGIYMTKNTILSTSTLSSAAAAKKTHKINQIHEGSVTIEIVFAVYYQPSYVFEDLVRSLWK